MCGGGVPELGVFGAVCVAILVQGEEAGEVVGGDGGLRHDPFGEGEDGLA